MSFPLPSVPSTTTRQRFSVRELWPIAIAALLLGASAFWLWKGKWKLGHDDWFLAPNGLLWPFGAWLLPLFVLFLLGGLAGLSAYDRFRRAKSSKEARASTQLCVGALSLLALVWPFVLQGPGTPAVAGIPARPGAFNLVSTFWSDVSNGYFGASYEITNPREFARAYADRQQPAPARALAHVATHPPGATLLYYGARRVYESVPPLQSAMTGLAAPLVLPAPGENNLNNLQSRDEQMRATLSQLRDERRLAVRSAVSERAPMPRDLPPSALGAALWCALLSALAVALTTPAVFALAAGHDRDDVAASDARGIIASALWVLCPSALFWAFSLDAVIACIVAWSLLMWSRRLGGAGASWALAAGAGWALATWVSFGALAVLAIFVVALGLQRRARPFHELACLGAGFVLTWIVLLLLFPTPLSRVFSQAMSAHHDATLTSRSRLVWTFLNFPFFAAFAGWALTLLVGAQAWTRAKLWLSTVINKTSAPPRTATDASAARPAGESESLPELAHAEAAVSWRVGDALGMAALSTALLLTLSGNVRGEVDRLWLFLLPPLCAWGAAWLARRPWPVMLAMLVLTAAQTLLFASALAPLARPF